jgi:tricorn protease
LRGCAGVVCLVGMRACILPCLLLGAAAMVAAHAGEAVAMQGIGAPVLSPDGRRVAFEWLDDLWMAPSEGGDAVRVVATPGRDAYPRFSPDGSRLVFSSDHRGGMQVHSVDLAGGGELRQHSFHSEGNELECLSPDGRGAVVRGLRERDGLRATRLMEIDLTSDRRERRIFDAAAHSPSWSPDGRVLLFCQGGEQLHRQGYRGSRASRIWSFEPRGRVFRLEVPGDFEARSPLWLRDGSGFYFVSNESGTYNLCIAKWPTGAIECLTHYRGEGVTSPDLSADGSTLVFRRGSEVFRWRPAADAQPVRVEFRTAETLRDPGEEVRRIRGCTDCTFTRDGSQVVFAAAGELWWIPRPGDPARRLTTTAQAEEQPRFSHDGGWLYFLRDDGLEADYFRARLHDGGLRDVQRVTRGGRSKSGFLASPDGTRIAWIEGTGDLHTAAADGTDARRVHPGWDKPAIDWSPDGAWLVVAAENASSDRDLLLVDPSGRRGSVNLTRHPGFEGSPRWSPDGRRIAFTARRDGSDAAALWLIDFGVRAPAADASEAMLQAAGDRATRVPTQGIEPIRLMWRPDAKALWYQSRRVSTKRLYEVAPGGEPRVVTESRGVPVGWSADGALQWRVGRSPSLWSRSGKSTVFPIYLEVRRPREDVLRLAFRRIWRTLGERFHDPRMNGRDWDALRRTHEPEAVAARSSRQFDAVVSRLFGNLNASHLSFVRNPWPDEETPSGKAAPTAHPGLMFDDGDADATAPLRIRSVLPGSPVAGVPAPPRPGEVIVRIAGEPVLNGSSLRRFLDGAVGRVLPFVIRAPGGVERTVEVRCISYLTARRLDREGRVAAAAAQVAALGPGATYVAVRDMGRAALDRLTLAIHRAPAGGGPLVLDLRDNGGGREADRMLAMFHPLAHSFTIPRDGPRGYPMERRGFPVWEGPMVVLCNANTFSNAEIFCHAIRHSGRAPLVGAATAGGVISAVGVPIPDAGTLQVPFRSWFAAHDGRSLDLNGAAPDHPVGLGPADEDAGTDPQLAKAIELLR